MSDKTCSNSYSALFLTAGSALWIKSLILSNLRDDLKDATSSISSFTWQYSLSRFLSSSDISRLSIKSSISGSLTKTSRLCGPLSSAGSLLCGSRLVLGSLLGGSGSSYLNRLGLKSSSEPLGGPLGGPFGGGEWLELLLLLVVFESESIPVIVVSSESITEIRSLSCPFSMPNSSRNRESIIGSITSSVWISPLNGLQCWTETILV